MERVYDTIGTFYIVPTMTGSKGLFAMDHEDYEKLLLVGMMNEEVDVTARRAEYGAEYTEDTLVSHKMRAGLYPIEMENRDPKPQLDFNGPDVKALLDRGVRDGDKVKLHIEGLPYKSYREANYDDVKLGLDEGMDLGFDLQEMMKTQEKLYNNE